LNFLDVLECVEARNIEFRFSNVQISSPAPLYGNIDQLIPNVSMLLGLVRNCALILLPQFEKVVAPAKNEHENLELGAVFY